LVNEYVPHAGIETAAPIAAAAAMALCSACELSDTAGDGKTPYRFASIGRIAEPLPIATCPLANAGKV